ncbi:MAG TPA: S-layer homology domain-containing protein [Negativicutes bacterium]|jgi:hypothetical protein
MKKAIMLLVSIFILSFASMALAAGEPFSDIPAQHWTYDALKKLAQVGIVNDDNGRLLGNKTLTRYEMAEIVANALTKADKADAETKALVNKLATEFADELKSLNVNVRVTKLEDKANSIRYSGNFFYQYSANNPGPGMSPKIASQKHLRWQQQNFFDIKSTDTVSFHVNFETPGTRFIGTTPSYAMDVAFVQLDKFAGLDRITIGRQPLWGFGNGIFSRPIDTDGINITKKLGNTTYNFYMADIQALPGEATPANPNPTGPGHDGAATAIQTLPVLKFAQAFTKLSDNFSVGGGYYWAHINQGAAFMGGNFNNGYFNSSRGYDLSFVAKLDKSSGLKLFGDYVGSTLDLYPDNKPNANGSRLGKNPHGWVLELTNSKYFAWYQPISELVSPKAAVGTDAWMVMAYNFGPGATPPGTNVADGGTASNAAGGGVNITYGDNTKGLWFEYQRCVAKNVLLFARFMDIKVSNQAATSMAQKKIDQIFQMRLRFYW